MEATIRLEFDSEKDAKAVAEAISPENFSAPTGLLVKTRREKCCVVTEVRTKRSMSTFISTIDDLLFSVSIAEKALSAAKTR